MGIDDKGIKSILNRHSCRNFTGGSIYDGDLNLLLESLRWAPSAGNIQPCFFYLVKNDEIKKKLAKAAYGQYFLARAALVFVVCCNPEESAAYYGERGRNLYCFQDTAAAVENLLIAATALGYGSCWIGAFNEEETKKVLNIPNNLRPIAIVPVGPGILPKRFPGKKPLSRILKIIE